MPEPDAPRDDLIRMAASLEMRAEVGDGRTMVGYAARFNEATVINSWEGNFEETIAPGAFKRTLRNNGDKVKILFNHGFDPSIGDKPLGRASLIKEDTQGLYVEVPLSRTTYNDDLIELLNDGALDGMSFRFSVVHDEWEQPTRKGQLPKRTITEAKLFELGPVTFPAYEATTVGVRSRADFDTWRALDDDRRAKLREIITGTSEPPPAEGTEGDEPADSTTRSDSEPPAATTPRITRRHKAQIAVARLRGDIPNDQQHRQTA